ncbi:unnamed protein product [Pedinophyceae sp. YPF-701]|nr:unnamed protein product [Pedinophyceae sp. YPF-701]
MPVTVPSRICCPLTVHIRSGNTTRASWRAASAMAQNSGDVLPAPFLDLSRVSDAHCHPQLDTAAISDIHTTPARTFAIMSVSHATWPAVDTACAHLPIGRAIPAFGIHPWWAHLHASSAYRTKRDILVTKPRPRASPEQALAAAECALAALPEPVPLDTWRDELRRRLEHDPGAIVGECGIDRAAEVLEGLPHAHHDDVLPHCRLECSEEHQWSVLGEHLALAGELQRPISLHCVRSYGRLEQELRVVARRDAASIPPRVMLHSYGGSPEMVRNFVALPNGLGARVYFSFNAVVRNGRAKLLARVAAVPDDRVLVESDVTSVAGLAPGLRAAVELVAEAKGWSLPETAERVEANFRSFYEAQLRAVAAA